MPKNVYLDKKGSRKSTGRAYQSRKKKHHPMNRYSMENEEASISISAKKLKSSKNNDFEVNASFGYRLINFVLVFSAICEAVKCKICGGEINFIETSVRGLGFKLKLNCASCEPVLIDSCPLINGRAYDINRRIVFAFRLLGIGLAGIDKFCGIMDLPKPIFQSFYDKIVNDIHIAAKRICKLSMKNAIDETKKLDNVETLTVSGDGTWRKRDYSSITQYSTFNIQGFKCVLTKITIFWTLQTRNSRTRPDFIRGYKHNMERKRKEIRRQPTFLALPIFRFSYMQSYNPLVLLVREK